MDPLSALPSLVTRLPPGTVSTHPGELATHARDRWPLALLRDVRGDRVPPGAVLAFPRSTEDVVIILSWAQDTGVPVVPRGGASGVAGGAEALRRCIVLETSHLDRILAVDEVSQTAHVQGGVTGAALDAALAPKGLTAGHDLASLEVATVGGWVASASVGYASVGFGAVEDLVLGLTVVLAGGDVLHLKPVPRSGAGPDLRRLFVGSEGTLGVITEVTLGVARAKGYLWEAFLPHSFETGMALVREIAQRGYRPLVVRMLDEPEARATFGPFAQRPTSVLMVGFDATSPGGDAERFDLRRLARDGGARMGERALAEHWWEHRYDGLARQQAVMGPDRVAGKGVIADALDVAGLWRRLPRLYEEVRGAVLEAADEVGTRLLHPTGAGAALEFSFQIRAEDDRSAEERYLEAWHAGVTAALEAGGTLAHHQGVGVRSVAFMADETGIEGLATLARIKGALDPRGILNPGKLLPSPAPAPVSDIDSDSDMDSDSDSEKE